MNALRLHLQAAFLFARYEQGGGINHLDQAIILQREALRLCLLGSPSRLQSLDNLAVFLSCRYEQLWEVENLDETIVLYQEVLDLCPSGHSHRPYTLNRLVPHLYTRYKLLGRLNDLNESIDRGKETLELCPPGHPDRAGALNNLAVSLSTRYNQLGMTEDLNEAIVLNRVALELYPSGHPNRFSPLMNLASHLSARYHQLGNMKDLGEAIVLGRNALELCSRGHSHRAGCLSNLANDLSTRYDRFGKMKDLDEAIVVGREALRFLSPGEPDQWKPLTNLAALLTTRHHQLRVIDDLLEAIVHDRNALEMCPPGNPDRYIPLNSLAVDLSTLYDRNQKIEAIDEAIFLGREVLVLCPPGHPSRPMFLSNLAVRLNTRSIRVPQNLDDIIALDQEALELLPSGEPSRSQILNDYAIHFAARYDRHKETKDLDKAISLHREALELRPPGNPHRPYSLYILASTLCTRFAQIGDVDDQEELFTLYAELADVSQTVSINDLFAARSWVRAAEQFEHPTILEAYHTSLRLLVQHLATLPSLPRNIHLFKSLTSSLAVDAFSACLRNHSLANAVELLEQGRGVFWSQLTRLRSLLDDVITSGQGGKKLADKFSQLASQIRNTAGHDQAWRLNLQLQSVVTDIRRLPGFSRFLLPPLFSELQQAASEGPVIIVNASQYSCDALVVLPNQDPVHIPLSITKENVQSLSLTFRSLSRRVNSMDVTKELARSLRDLWDDVISPIANFLQLILPPRSRVWWCPTSEFFLLPLHAAGPYRRGQQNFPDLYISSYTPTLTALIRARQQAKPHTAAEPKHFIAIGQAKAHGESELISVSSELATVARQVEGIATFTCIEGEEACIARVSEELGKNQWIHLACHGIPDPKRPFESAFALADGHFTIQHIIKCEPKNPQFAYLSACHTTMEDEQNTDEVIHLASAIQFAGFRSVIGTMWAVDDGETNKITSMFYKNMVDESGRLDHTRAAFALNKTVRSVDVPFDQRILYIHIGA